MQPYKWTLALALLFVAPNVLADEMELDLSALMEIKIESASKKSESLFEAPMAASVLSRQEIEDSGVTTVPEALRLMPGVIVREQSNGNYDVQLRGMDNPLELGAFYTYNTYTLVMVDNRVVYNYLIGNFDFATIGVAMSDIERIEVVRGPTAALYGPNAVAGAINIITRRSAKPGLHTEVVASGGMAKPYDYSLGDKDLSHVPIDGRTEGRITYGSETVNIFLNANYQRKDRFTPALFSKASGTYQDDPRAIDIIGRDGTASRTADGRAAFPNLTLGTERIGASVQGKIEPDDDTQLNFTGGVQSTKYTRMSPSSDATHLSQNQLNTSWLQARLSRGGFSSRFSVTQNASVSYDFLALPARPATERAIDLEADYTIEIGEGEIRPGIAIKRVHSLSDAIGGQRGGVEANLRAPSIRAEYTFADQLRIIGAARADFYDHRDASKPIPGWNASATWLASDDHLLRLGYGRGARYIFMLDVYADLDDPRFFVSGNTDVDPLVVDSYEAGYRGRFGRLTLDVEGFLNFARDFNFFFSDGLQDGRLKLFYGNIESKVTHMGGTMSVHYRASKRFDLRTHATLQKSVVEKRVISNSNALADPRYLDEDSDAPSPAVIGGIAATWQIVDALKLHLDGYFLSSYEQRMSTAETDGVIEARTHDFAALALMNVRIAYDFSPQLNAHIMARNLRLAGDKRQFLENDEVGSLYMAGVTLEY